MNTLLDFVLNFSGPTPYIFIFVILLACGFGLPIPEDIVLFAAGMLAFYGGANIFVMVAVCFAGVMVGDAAVFAIGAIYGRRVTKLSFMRRLLPPKRLNVVKKKLHEQGAKVIFAARFMPGLRMPIFFSAGTLHLPFRVFFFYDGLAALLSVPAIVYTVFHFGEEVDHVVKIIKRVERGILFTILAIVAYVIFKIYLSRKKKRDLELDTLGKGPLSG